MDSRRPERAERTGDSTSARAAGRLRVVICARPKAANAQCGLLRRVVDWYVQRDGSALLLLENRAALADPALAPDLVLVDLDPQHQPIGGCAGIGRWLRAGAFTLCIYGTAEGEREYERVKGVLREGAFELLSSRQLGFRGILRAVRAAVRRAESYSVRGREGEVPGERGESARPVRTGIPAPEQSAPKRQGRLFDWDVA